MQGIFATGIELVSSEKPIRQGIFSILNSIPVVKRLIPDWLADSSYYKDGLIIAHTITVSATAHKMTGVALDGNLTNVHSCGWINTACLPAYKFLHLTMVRHGSPFQVIDPWPTSWYGTWWSQTIPRDLVLGDTIGEAYMKGMQHVGIQYISEPAEFWWDVSNNVCLFGDPDLRPLVPGTEYSNKNYWERKDTRPLDYDESFDVDGHMPYGATGHPNAQEPPSFLEQYYMYIIIAAIIIIAALIIVRRKKKK